MKRKFLSGIELEKCDVVPISDGRKSKHCSGTQMPHCNMTIRIATAKEQKSFASFLQKRRIFFLEERSKELLLFQFRRYPRRGSGK
jgi:hypothetical protein